MHSACTHLICGSSRGKMSSASAATPGCATKLAGGSVSEAAKGPGTQLPSVWYIRICEQEHPSIISSSNKHQYDNAVSCGGDRAVSMWMCNARQILWYTVKSTGMHAARHAVQRTWVPLHQPILTASMSGASQCTPRSKMKRCLRTGGKGKCASGE